jgi:hypothetical protein
MKQFSKLFFASLTSIAACAWADEEKHCSYFEEGVKNVYWGDLHVHSAYSLDAWGYGTLATPAEAYRFARGEPLVLTGVGPVVLERPLDFMSVTDHAEWFDLLYICTDPEWSDDPYCDTMTEKNTPEAGSEVFAKYVLPTITKASPQPTPICKADEAHCTESRASQWQRIQHQTNQANKPCKFTSMVGFEWSATPDYSHNHRNVIFANANVTKDAIDYMHFPSPLKLWEELDRQCEAKNGCEAIAIPHNTNMGDGRSFDVETEDEYQLDLRARYERLVEIHQEKGNSECLPVFGQVDEGCNFEIRLTKNSQPTTAADFNDQEWERMRRSYVRGLLLRGLAAFERSGTKRRNPFQLGIIASTDNHAATGGLVEEDQWPGSVFGMGSLERSMTRISWNPGGLIAVWAEENTRESLFTSLKRREVYGTSGPRIQVKIKAATDGKALSCASKGDTSQASIPMGGEFTTVSGSPYFVVQALYDRIPLASVEIIKGELKDAELKESTFTIWAPESGGLNICAEWQDPEFDSSAPAFWYARIIESPRPRWSSEQCKKAGRCDEFPNAMQTIQDRAWTSPIWYLPERNQ